MSDDKPENTNEGTGDVPPPDIPPPPVPEPDTPPPAPEVSKESAGEEPPPAPPKTEPQEQGGGMPPASSEKTMGMASHLLSFCGFVIPYIGSLLGPLVLWFLKKDQSKAVRDEGRKSVNFQATFLVVTTAVLILMTISSLVPIINILMSFLGLLAIVALCIANIVLVIIATIKFNSGKKFQYPFSYDFLKLLKQ